MKMEIHEEGNYQQYENYEDIPIISRSDQYPNESGPEKARWTVAGKKRGRPSAKGDAKEWLDNEIYLLIELWEKKDILYNTKHVLYYNKEERDNAVKEIQKFLLEQNTSASIEQITDKMTNLKCYYGSQKRNMENMKLNGSDENYVSPWKFFYHLRFLNGHFLQRTPTTRRRYIVNNHQNINNNPHNNPHFKTIKTENGVGCGSGRQQHSPQPPPQFPYEGPPSAKVTIVDPYIIHTPKASMVDPYAKTYISPIGKPYSPPGESKYWNEPPAEHKRINSSPTNHSTSNGGSMTSTTNSKSSSSLPNDISRIKSEDDCFCELMCKMLNQIPESEEKAMLRLDMQQKVISLRYRS